MDCQEINNQLEALLDRELEPAQATAVRRHLAHCVECRDELERLRSLKTALQSVESPIPSARLDERVMVAFRLQRARARGAGASGGWRDWFVSSFSVPKPALALVATLLVGTAALAYKAGEIMGMRLAPPALVYNKTAPPQPAPESVRVVYVKTRDVCPRPNSQPSATLAQNRLAGTAGVQTAVSQFETRASASDAGIDYVTSAALENFEPVKDAGVRVIKGGNQ
jgi:anti-sigma factor RsiW